MNKNLIARDKAKNELAPLYWVEGVEEYLVNEVVFWVENHFLSEAEKAFDFSVFYGKEATFEQVFNACRKAPLVAGYNVVLLKDGQLFKDLKRFEGYFLKPLAQTILIVVYKEKAFDYKTKFGGVVKTMAKRVVFEKMKEMEVETWVQQWVNERGFKIEQKAIGLLIQQVGFDITKMVNELKKIFLNHDQSKSIGFEVVAEFVGVNKAYNIFELQQAFGVKNREKIFEIMGYMMRHEKGNPFLQINIMLYRFFCKVLVAIENGGLGERDLAGKLGVSPFFVKEYIVAAKLYKKEEVEKNILVLSDYNLKALNVKAEGLSDGDLKREMVMKLILA